MSGRPGPVVLALPEDMLSATCADVADLPAPAPRVAGVPDAAVQAVLDALAPQSVRWSMPGGSLWDRQAADDLARFAEARHLPVAVPFRRQDSHGQPLGQLCGRSGRRHEPGAGAGG